MRNSVGPIPWTHRDSRPRSQAELDEEEQFNVYKEKELCAPRHCRTELDRLLDHYQEMITRLIDDPEFVYRIDMEDSFFRDTQRRAAESLALLRTKPLYKKGRKGKPKIDGLGRPIIPLPDPEPREPREPKPEPKPWARKVDPAPPPPYFDHLNQVVDQTYEADPPTRRELIDSAVREARRAKADMEFRMKMSFTQPHVPSWHTEEERVALIMKAWELHVQRCKEGRA